MTLDGIYGGPKINGKRLYYFDPHMNFWSCIELTNDMQNNMKLHSNTESEEVACIEEQSSVTSACGLLMSETPRPRFISDLKRQFLLWPEMSRSSWR